MIIIITLLMCSIKKIEQCIKQDAIVEEDISSNLSFDYASSTMLPLERKKNGYNLTLLI